jgi:hypothetical protein
MLRSYTSIPITRQPYPTAVNFPAYLLKKRGEFAYYATRKEKKKGNDVPAKRKRKRCLAPRHVIDRYQNMGPGVFLKTARSMANYPCDGLNYTWARATMLYNENHHHQEVKMNHMGKLVELHPIFYFFSPTFTGSGSSYQCLIQVGRVRQRDIEPSKLSKPFSSARASFFFFLFGGLFDLLSLWRKSKHSKNQVGCCWIVDGHQSSSYS